MFSCQTMLSEEVLILQDVSASQCSRIQQLKEADVSDSER